MQNLFVLPVTPSPSSFHLFFPTANLTSQSPGLKEGDLLDHPHKSLQYHLGPKLLELSVNRLYQTCDPERAAQASPKLPGPEHGYWCCYLCLNNLAWDKMSAMCFAGGCANVHFCAACMQAQRTAHRHALSQVVVKRMLPAMIRAVKCGGCQKGTFVLAYLICISCLLSALCGKGNN
jgi:hypothetical protein